MFFQCIGNILPYLIGFPILLIKDGLSRARILLGIGAIFPLVTLPFMGKSENSEYIESVAARRRSRGGMLQQIVTHLRYGKTWSDLAGTAGCWFLYGQYSRSSRAKLDRSYYDFKL